MSPGAPRDVGPHAGATTTLEGVLERVTYENEETAWSVVKLSVSGRRDPVTAVGPLLGVQPGENLRVRGQWTVDRKWGEQFRVESFTTVRPATLVGIERYLSSGLVRGVGDVMAQRLVQQFGLETLDVIERAPARLTEVEGIGPIRRDRIEKAWVEQRQIKDVMLFLQSHGVAVSHAIRIFKHYGERAIAAVEKNPYRLAVDIFGIGFKTADGIAQELGISPRSPERIKAGVLHALGESASEGNLYEPEHGLAALTARLLEVPESDVATAIETLAHQGDVLAVPLLEGAALGAREGDDGTAPKGGARAIYLRPLHAAESGTATLLRALLDAPAPDPVRDLDRVLKEFEGQIGIELADAQREAVRRAVTSRLLVVTGGPGTGKTTLVKAMLHVLERAGCRIALAAPTGRAARRLAETTGRDARTLHRLLEFDPRAMSFQRDRERPLDADLIVVDETSMVDQILAHALLKAVPPSARLVLVGDSDQLPSVGPGSVLREIIRAEAPLVRLSHIFRQARQSLIIVNAHRINSGEPPQVPEAGAQGDFYLIEREEPEDVLATLKQVVQERIPKRFGLHPIDDVQVLSPMHRGLLGATNLNAELQGLLNPRGTSIVRGARVLRVGDKVMQMRNNYDLDVANGDIGRIDLIDEDERTTDVVFDGRRVTYDFAELDELVLAYACSVHKAQGSEYPCVVVPIHTQHYVMLQRNLLYTAVTRARRLVVLIGNRRAVAIAVRNARTQLRNTQLAARIRTSI